MADVNVDANLIKEQGALVHVEEKMVELSNGCICCTLREDLLTELAKLARHGREHGLDHILIESSGISEPLPVAETFTFQDPQSGTSLNDIARLDTLVTVVDGSSFLDELHAAEKLKGRGWQAEDGDERTVAQLFCDQLEFANVVVMNKMDLLDDAGRARLRATLRRFNPEAELVEATYGRVAPATILGTGLFKLERAAEHPTWLKEARVGEHKPESVEYGISSFTFRSRRPFDEARFGALAEAMQTRGVWAAGGNSGAAKGADGLPPPGHTPFTWGAAGAEGRTPPGHTAFSWAAEEAADANGDAAVTAAGRAAAARVVRAKGLVWVATRSGYWEKGQASLAGATFAVSFGQPWAAATAGCVAAEAKEKESQVQWGDRRTELVVIGQDLDHGAMTAALERACVTDDELAAYAASSRREQERFLTFMKTGTRPAGTKWGGEQAGVKQAQQQQGAAAPPDAAAAKAALTRKLAAAEKQLAAARARLAASQTSK